MVVQESNYTFEIVREPHPHLALNHHATFSHTMELTFMTELGQSFVIEIDPNMELENVMALLEAEVRETGCSF